MNPITVFLTIACLVVGAALVATGHLVPGAVSWSSRSSSPPR